MVPLEQLPGYREWGGRLQALLAFEGPLWIWGEPGAGVSTFLHWAAERRTAPALDDAEALEPGRLQAWLRDHPDGVAGGHAGPEAPGSVAAVRCLAFRLPSLEEDPAAIPALLEALAAEEDVPGALPAALGALPCPGNLRGLRNRLLRWKLLGQLPEPVAPELEMAEDLATHLHALERTLLFRALRRSYGNRVEAAARLGVSRRQLYLLIARHGDPVRGEAPRGPAPKRLVRQKNRQNSSRGNGGR